jgi:nucleoside-diphosphate-sugar epimerase
MIEAARLHDAGRFLFSSSACVYRQDKQKTPDVVPLKEEDAWPADPEPGYGLEKLFMEKMCEYYSSTYGMKVRVARFHNVYGPYGTYRGGREKAPAAICRKVAEAKDGGAIEVWGDGKQTRSFLFIDDCCEGVYRLMESGYMLPLNIGSEEMVSIDELVQIVSMLAKKDVIISHIDGPQGVRGRNSDNTLMRSTLMWEPEVTLERGLRFTYEWILNQVNDEWISKQENRIY